ncbi:GTP cyclohydrolase I [Trichoderma harzianum]|uniref:GTP cyclohydrolase 1 n=1 Tax=Trichoderma harzianum TaxID=5544 RepID=A0A0F9Z736_TRIHA|nr:GTP cyclohydrolase I [Trichoderma harzianum]
MQGAVRTLLECIGEDPSRNGLLDTPSRYAKALLFLTQGYHVNVEDIVNNALFHEDHNASTLLKKATNLPIGRQAASNSKIGIICCYSTPQRPMATTRRVAGPRPMAHDNVAQQESRADDTFASPSSEPAMQRWRKDSQGISSKPP